MPRGGVTELVKEFRCGQATVYNALAFKTTSLLADKIRQEAMKRGGIYNYTFLPVDDYYGYKKTKRETTQRKENCQ